MSDARLYRRPRFLPDVSAHAVWLYFRFPLSLRMVEDLLAERGIIVSHQTVRAWVEKLGREFAKTPSPFGWQTRPRSPGHPAPDAMAFGMTGLCAAGRPPRVSGPWGLSPMEPPAAPCQRSENTSANSTRRSRFRIFPLAFLGNWSVISTCLGALKCASASRQ